MENKHCFRMNCMSSISFVHAADFSAWCSFQTTWPIRLVDDSSIKSSRSRDDVNTTTD